MTHRENSAIMQAGYHIIQQATYICTHQKAEACHCPQLPNMKQHGMLEQVHKISFDYPLTISIDVYRIISPASAYVKKMATAIPLLTNFWGKCNSHPLSRLAEFPGFLKWRQRNRKRPPKKGLRIKETNLRSWRKTKLAKGHSFCKSAMGIYGFHHQIEGFKPRILRYDVLPYGKEKKYRAPPRRQPSECLKSLRTKKTNNKHVWMWFHQYLKWKPFVTGFFPRSCSNQILTMYETISWNILMECCGPWPLDL